MDTYTYCPHPNSQLMHRRSRPNSLPNSNGRHHHHKMVHPYKKPPTQQYSAPAHQPREDMIRAGKYLIRNDSMKIDDTFLAYNVMDQKYYVTMMVPKKDCQKVLSKYKELCYSTELPHIHEILSEQDNVLLVLNLHPYSDPLPQTADLEKVQKFTKEILELVNKVHESGISPHKMSIDDFKQYKETPTSIGYHLQLMRLNHSLMLNNSDEELADIDACSAPELVNILTSQKNKSNPMDSTNISNSKNKLEAIRDNGLDLEKADSWRVGTMIYTMIAGRSPFPDPITETQKYFEAIKYSQLKPPTRKTSRNAWEFLLGLLEPDPEERLSITQALEHPWLQEYALRTESHGMLSGKEEHKLPSSTPSSPTF
ncbi:Tribbles-like protein 3-like [Oopsacas minuta]|uniref:Tribbles-like protein 3-like n=1 Tax=Oopsacas minuta TaxID=111878 RepID=A0AAV7JI61_9METZ|nr:Tribbles-like protein 3-like [Oopsacas minuta]